LLFFILSPAKYWVSLQIIKLFIMYFSPSPYFLIPFRPKHSYSSRFNHPHNTG
jgi:hypothetical protein